MPGSDHSVILHIGLHKTGTRYLQREVFRALDPRHSSYNPPALWQAIRHAARNPDDAAARRVAAEAVADWRRSGDARTLVLSEPHISGDMYGNHHDHRANALLMRTLFPEARVIYFVRDQADWLQSAYRQQLVKGGSVPLHVFLNHYHGVFHERPDRWVHGARTVEALNQRFLQIYTTYAELFGTDAVTLLRQEDLRRRPAAVHACLAGVLGLESLPRAAAGSHNRSYSALAIRLFHPWTLRRLPPPSAADTGRPARRLRGLLRPLLRLRRVFIQHVFDRLLYVDWDLLAADGMRSRIEQYYAAENAELERIAHRLLREHPDNAGAAQRPADDAKYGSHRTEATSVRS